MMKTNFLTPTLGLVLAFGLAACRQEPTSTPQVGGDTASPSPPAAVASSGQPTAFAGTVIETTNSGGYTYIKVRTGGDSMWAATTPFRVQVGDSVIVPPGMPMTNFHSNTLERDFDVIYFVDSVRVGSAHADPGALSQLPKGHPPLEGLAGQVPQDFSGLQKVEGGQTIAEIFTGKAELKGKEIKVRGKVIKFSANIMGKNWLHLKDGTGAAGTDDLTITTSAQAKVGDTVVVTGKVAVDQDFGFNYKYPVLIEEATLVVE